MAKEGSAVSGLMDSFATAVSLALQYGVPLKVLVDKFSHTRFEPSGWTGNQDIPYAKSVMDYIFRWLGLKFIPGYQANGNELESEIPSRAEPALSLPKGEGTVPTPAAPTRASQIGRASCRERG